MIEPKETKLLPCIYSAISRCFQPVGWLARSWHSLHQASTNTLYISRHEDRPLLVFMSGLCRLTYLRDEEMKHWHRHHFLVDEYIGHFNSCSDQVLYWCTYTGFSPGVFSQESQLGWQNIGLKSWRFCRNCDWQAHISGVAFYYLAAQQPVKKSQRRRF